MVAKNKMIISLITTALLASSAFMSFSNDTVASHSELNCQCEYASQATLHAQTSFNACDFESHNNWFSWLSGGSSSAQFHYLDLLELLLASDSDNNSRDFTGSF